MVWLKLTIGTAIRNMIGFSALFDVSRVGKPPQE
jgi:hypothetical protein